MKRLMKVVWWAIFVLFAAGAMAQSPEPPARERFSQAELDQMLAPIALYPDSLLSQILMAASYPRDVADAAAWSRANRGARGEGAVRAAENEPWDPSVVSLTAFPEILAMLDERPRWTEDLGIAYVEQPDQVMDTVQGLRARADAAGTLRSSEEMMVRRDEGYYVVEPPTPEMVYVPYYDPRYAYGSWWWPDYPPVYWRPWAGYSYYGHGGFGWGYGVTLGTGFFYGAFDWPRRYIRYSHHRPWYYHGRDYRRGDRWTHDRYRRGDGYRWADRDSRWRDGRYRDGGDRWRDGSRDRTRDGDRWRDGYRDRTRDGDRLRSGDGERWRRDRRDPPATSPNPQVDQRLARPMSPRPPTEATTRTRPQYREDGVPAQPANGIARPAEGRTYGVPRAARVQPAPQVQQQYAPAPQIQRAPAPQIQRAPAPQPRMSPPPPRQSDPAPAPAQQQSAPAPSRNPAERRSTETSSQRGSSNPAAR